MISKSKMNNGNTPYANQHVDYSFLNQYDGYTGPSMTAFEQLTHKISELDGSQLCGLLGCIGATGAIGCIACLRGRCNEHAPIPQNFMEQIPYQNQDYYMNEQPDNNDDNNGNDNANDNNDDHSYEDYGF